MFILLKLINTVTYSGNIIASLNTIDDFQDEVNKLIIKLLSIEEDFKSMEVYFDKKYNILISTYKNKMDMKEFSLEHSKNKVGCDKYKSDKRHPGPTKSEYRARIFGKIVFRNFLEFYDECSYVINERIKEIYETTFQRIINGSIIFSSLEMLFFRYAINDEILKKVKYRNLHYFRNKLEEKLAANFKISTAGIRSILYGRNFKNEYLRENYIQKYYETILNYKRYCRARNTDIYEFFEVLYYGGNLTGQEKAIKTSMSKYAHYFNIDLPHLYNYHKAILRKFTLSKTRFIIYEEMIFKYGRWKEFPTVFRGEDKLFFAKYNLYQGDDLELGLREQIFEHVCYSDATRNVYFCLFNEIKSFLVP